MATKIKVKLVRSGIGRPGKQKKVLKGLGLGRMNSSKVHPDTESIRGMIRKVHHLVEVEPAE